MITKITFQKDLDEKYNEILYSEESSKNVLRSLIKKGYHVVKYNKIKSEFGSILKTARIEIEDHVGLRCEKNLELICLNEGDTQRYNPKSEEIINSFVRGYLLNSVTIKSGRRTLGPGGREIHSTHSKLKCINYLKTRKTKKNEEKEIYLQDILDYARAVFGEKFSLKDLERIANKEEKEMSKKGQPERTYFATLRPSRG
jgi:hypothetical protein